MNNHKKTSRGYHSDGQGGTEEWVGIDGEGVTTAFEHKYVLLFCGDEYIEDPDGLQWPRIFEFLYSQRREKTAYVGFYLAYDFTQWLKTLPRGKAWRLLTDEGKQARKSRSPKLQGRYLPVDLDGWQIDILGAKRLQIRPRVCECGTVKCEHPQKKWMYICDAGHFFQCSFVQAIDPTSWQSDAPCTGEEFKTILAGKKRRASAKLDEEMRTYTRLEVKILARMMRSLDEGFRKLGITLSPQKWFGPGQAAQAWLLKQAGAIRTKDLPDIVPEWFLEAARLSYFGGWFEIMAHGIIPRISYEYDINSAYPSVIATLPCLRHGRYQQGIRSGHIAADLADTAVVYVEATVEGSNHSVGAMLHRTPDARILRPTKTRGWFDYQELKAACKAELIDSIQVDRWVSYEPCDCVPPFAGIAGLYETRLHLGKDSILGRACKLVYNSAYGKLCQSVGHPTTANPVYAAMITSGCRRMILDAIATHPRRTSAVLMVATDAVFFDSAHDGLSISSELGEWGTKRRLNLTLFKPGVYWDDAAREALHVGKLPVFKARGVSARDFGQQIERIDGMYREPEWLSIAENEETRVVKYLMGAHSWPTVYMATMFSMTSCLQALQKHAWEEAGRVQTKIVEQSSDPSDKRTAPYWIEEENFYRTRPRTVEDFKSTPYAKKFGLEDPYSDAYLDATLGVTPDDERPFVSIMRFIRDAGK
jgi:hypothetical protein